MPANVTACGLPPPSSLTSKVAVRVPEAVGAKVTLMVQRLPAAKSPGQVLLVENSVASAPRTAICQVFIGALLALAKVIVCAVLLVPTVCAGKIRLDGVRLVAVPTPVSTIVCGVDPSLSLTTMDDLRGPLALGMKLALIVQLVPPARVLGAIGQLLLWLKSPLFPPVIPILLIVSGCEPALVSVTVRQRAECAYDLRLKRERGWLEGSYDGVLHAEKVGISLAHGGRYGCVQGGERDRIGLSSGRRHGRVQDGKRRRIGLSSGRGYGSAQDRERQRVHLSRKGYGAAGRATVRVKRVEPVGCFDDLWNSASADSRRLGIDHRKAIGLSGNGTAVAVCTAGNDGIGTCSGAGGNVMVADVPVGSTDIAVSVGPPVGTKKKAAMRRFAPVIVAFGTTTLKSADLGQTEVITGKSATVTTKLVAEVAVLPATVTVILPVVAPTGTVATSVEVVAEVTVATVPLNFTMSEVGVALKPWPRIVTEAPTGTALRIEVEDGELTLSHRRAADREDVAHRVVGVGDDVPGLVDHRHEPAEVVVVVLDWLALGVQRLGPGYHEPYTD